MSNMSMWLKFITHAHMFTHQRLSLQRNCQMSIVALGKVGE
jgi:hypothetical protein